MVNRPLLAIALSVSVLSGGFGGFGGPAWSQAAPQKHALGLDAGPSSTPDPLAPPEVNGPAPVAPGAPTAPTEAKPSPRSTPS